MKLWKKLLLGMVASVGVLGIMLVILVALLLVPQASDRTITSIVATFSHSEPVLNADPENDFFFYVEEYASPFRINRAVQNEFLDSQFLADIQPGEQIEILAFKRYLPRNPQNTILLGSIPTWTVLQGDVSYMPNRLPENLSASQLD